MLNKEENSESDPNLAGCIKVKFGKIDLIFQATNS